MLTIKTDPEFSQRAWGVCPICGGADNIPIGRSHWRYCRAHGFMWLIAQDCYDQPLEDEPQNWWELLGKPTMLTNHLPCAVCFRMCANEGGAVLVFCSGRCADYWQAQQATGTHQTD